jgi:hypothetical protein
MFSGISIESDPIDPIESDPIDPLLILHPIYPGISIESDPIDPYFSIPFALKIEVRHHFEYQQLRRLSDNRA